MTGPELPLVGSIIIINNNLPVLLIMTTMMMMMVRDAVQIFLFQTFSLGVVFK